MHTPEATFIDLKVLEDLIETKSTVHNPQDAAALTQERGTTHGAFLDHARVTQRLKLVIHEELVKRQKRGQIPLSMQHVEALDMIMHKVGRIIAGDPTFQDHWDDIGGYAHIANKDFSQ